MKMIMMKSYWIFKILKENLKEVDLKVPNKLNHLPKFQKKDENVAFVESMDIIQAHIKKINHQANQII
ncbi:13529_t:CDS:1, partial [Gigaspora rosea]